MPSPQAGRQCLLLYLTYVSAAEVHIDQQAKAVASDLSGCRR